VSPEYKFRALPLHHPSQYCDNEYALLLSYEALTECRIRVLENLLTGFLSKVVVVFLCPYIQLLGYLFTISYDRFFKHPFLFIIL